MKKILTAIIVFISTLTGVMIGSYNGAEAVGYMEITSDKSFVIDKQNSWHHLPLFTNTLSQNVIFHAGATSTITGFWDYGGGLVGVTSTAHGLATGDPISITGTTNYEGLYEAGNVTANSFTITATWVANDATGKVTHGSHYEIEQGAGGKYQYSCHMTIAPVGANAIYEFTVVQHTSTNGISAQKFLVAGDQSHMSFAGVFVGNGGDHIGTVIRNITDANDLTIKYAQCILKKL